MKPMRILFGPACSQETNAGACVLQVLRQQHQVISFAGKEADIVYDYKYKTATFGDILKQLPRGWEPDLVLFWSPECFAIPAGLEECPFPAVAAVRDWHLGFHALREILPCFDYVFTDRQGVEVFRRAGYEKAEHALLGGFDPGEYYSMKGIEPVYDIGIVLPLNPQARRKHSPWLARIAALSDRHRLRILNDLPAADQARALNQTKIAFNRSIHSEMNMPAYQAPACGSLLFYEEDNLEVRDVYTDHIHCVLYNRDNLEELLEYYLTHEEERLRIVEAACKQVQSYSWEHQARRLLERIQALGIPDLKHPLRRFFALNQISKQRARAIQAMQSQSAGSLLVAERELRKAGLADPSDPATQNNLGVVYARYAQGLPDPLHRAQFFRQALSCFEAALKLAPGYAVAEGNRGFCLLALGNPREAESAFRQAITLLKDCSFDLFIHSTYVPDVYDAFRIEYELLGARFADNPQRYVAGMQTLLKWRLYEILGEIRTERQAWAPAADALREAIAAMPSGTTRHRLARVLEAIGFFEEAIAELKQALIEEPLLLAVYEDLARLLFQQHLWEECSQICRKALNIIQAYPLHESAAACFREWQSRCRIYQTQNEPQDPMMLSPGLQTSPPEPVIRELKDVNFLYWPLLPWEDASWKPVLKAYTDLFTDQDPVTLVINPHGVQICSEARLEAIAAEMQSFLIEMGRAPTHTADILLLDAETASATPEAIASKCQALVACARELILPDIPLPLIRGSTGEDLAGQWQRFWERYSDRKPSQPAGQEEARHAPYADLFKGFRKVLDIGCGPGLFLELLAERGIPAEGMDSNPEMIACCQAKGLQAFVADARQMEMLTGEYDGIHAGHVIERMAGEEAIRFLGECVRLLSPGGLLIVRTINWAHPAVREGGFWLDHTHVRPYPLPLLHRIFLDLRLDILQSGAEETGWNNLYIVGRKPGGQ